MHPARNVEHVGAPVTDVRSLRRTSSAWGVSPM